MTMQDRANDVNNVAPSSLSHIIGQRSVVDQVRVALDAAFEDCRKMDSALLVGPPGCGKSALARVIAAEMATELHETLGQLITSPADLNAMLGKESPHYLENDGLYFIIRPPTKKGSLGKEAAPMSWSMSNRRQNTNDNVAR